MQQEQQQQQQMKNHLTIKKYQAARKRGDQVRCSKFLRQVKIEYGAKKLNKAQTKWKWKYTYTHFQRKLNDRRTNCHCTTHCGRIRNNPDKMPQEYVGLPKCSWECHLFSDGSRSIQRMVLFEKFHFWLEAPIYSKWHNNIWTLFSESPRSNKKNQWLWIFEHSL